MFDSFLGHSMIKRARERKLVEIKVHDLRDYTEDKHRTCDDKPFGGGPGMLMKPEPVFRAFDKLFRKKRAKRSFRFIYLSPQGKPFDQAAAERLAGYKELAFLCGHYEGLDQRVIDELVDEEISIGDYVLTQGELPAMVVADTVVRLQKKVMGNADSKVFESFSHNLLEYPQYTRPSVYRGLRVPAILLSGDHQKIDQWRRREAYKLTQKRRPDLLPAGRQEKKVKKEF